MGRVAEPRPLLLGMGWFPDQPGGLNRYFRDLLAALSVQGVTARGVVYGPVAEVPPGRIIAVPTGGGLPGRLWRFAKASSRAREASDVVDAHFALYSLIPTLVGGLRRVPLVVHFQGPWAQESANAGERGTWRLAAKRRIERLVYRRAREVVVLSGAFRRLLVEGYGVSPWRVHVVPPGVDLAKFSPASMAAARKGLGLPDDVPIAVAVRRLVPRMGLDILVDAWKSVVAGSPGALLLIAGDGPLRDELAGQATRLGIAGQVRLLGKVTDGELLSCYRAADVCVVPSVALEGFGLVVLEALACGTPVVATESGGLPEALSGLDGSLIVPAGDSRALACRLDSAFAGTDPLPSRGVCRRHAENFSWGRAAAANLDVYRRAIDDPATSRLRVVYLDHFAGLSGGEIALARLLPALTGVDPHVILANEGPLVPLLSRAGLSLEVLPMADAARGLRKERVRVRGVSATAIAGSIAYTVKLAQRLRRLRPDIVHTNSLKAALYGAIAGRIAGVPVVWHIRDRIAADYLPAPAVRLVRAMARRFPDAIIFNSETTLRTLPAGGGLRRVIPSPVPHAPERPAGLAGADGGLRVGMVGRMAAWKGQHVFIEAFARAFPAGPERGIIVGAALFGEDDYAQELKELAALRGLDGRLEFRGFQADVAAQMATFDVLVHASVIPEPFGLVVMEGMAAGLPVVAPAVGGPSEVIEDGVNGILYPPGSADALTEVLKRLAEDPALRLRLGVAARAKARSYTPEVIGQQVIELYRSVLERRGLP